MADSSDGATTQSWWRRFLHTPAGDILRGRGVTARFDFTGRLKRGLPHELVKPMRRFCNRTRLFPQELDRLVDEVIEDCHRDLAQGRSTEQIIDRYRGKAFIKATRKRYFMQRHPLSRAAYYVAAAFSYAMLVLMVCYVLSIPYFYFARPTLAVDYLAMFNATAAAVPEQDRAWPLYREVTIDLRRYQDDQGGAVGGITSAGQDPLPLSDGYSPAHPQWATIRSFLKSHPELGAKIRFASEKPGMGYIAAYRGDYSEQDALAFFGPAPNTPEQAEPQPDEHWDDLHRPMSRYLMFFHLAGMRQLSKIVVADSFLALEENDGERFTQNITAISRLGTHTAELPNDMCALVGMSFRAEAYACISDAVRHYPDALKESHITLLQHMLAEHAQSSLYQIEGKRIELYDSIQRVYTSGGPGGGHVTTDAFIAMTRLAHEMDGRDTPRTSPVVERFVHTLGTPAMALICPKRDTVENQVDAFLVEAERERSIPLHMQPVSTATDHVRLTSTWDHVRYLPLQVFWFLQPIPRETFARQEAQREGAATALALEQYRRGHGSWPTTLNELVPQYLAKPPMDPITGHDAKYLIADGKPLVYSVGIDRDDDRGRVPINPYSRPPKPEPWAAAKWVISEEPIDGDWRLFPLPESHIEAGVEATRFHAEQEELERKRREASGSY